MEKIVVTFKLTDVQKLLADLQIKGAVWVWNRGLLHKREAAARQAPKAANYKHLKEKIKAEFPPELSGVSSMVVDQALQELEHANYVGKQFHHSWVEEQIEETYHAKFVGELLTVAAGKITLPKVGRVAFEGEIPEGVRVSRVRLWRDEGEYFGELTCRAPDEARGTSWAEKRERPEKQKPSSIVPPHSSGDDGLGEKAVIARNNSEANRLAERLQSRYSNIRHGPNTTVHEIIQTEMERIGHPFAHRIPNSKYERYWSWAGRPWDDPYWHSTDAVGDRQFIVASCLVKPYRGAPLLYEADGETYCSDSAKIERHLDATEAELLAPTPVNNGI